MFLSLTSECEHRDYSCDYETFDEPFIYEFVIFMDQNVYRSGVIVSDVVDIARSKSSN